MSNMITILQNDFWKIGVLPGEGGSFAFGRIKYQGEWRDLLHPKPQKMTTAWDYASYMLVPWSNRIKAGSFGFQGKTYQLRINSEDQTAIHGATLEFPWEILESRSDYMALRFCARNFSGVNFPWDFEANATFALQGRRLVLSLRLRNDDQSPMPAGFGHHPVFVKTFAGDTDLPLLEVPCSRYYVAQGAIPSGAAVPVEPRVDFQNLRLMGTEFVDDCLTGRAPGKAIRIAYAQSGVALTMTADPIFEHIIVYNPTHKPVFAVEPVTNANDGFNLMERGIPGTGVFILQPGEEKSGEATMELTS